MIRNRPVIGTILLIIATMVSTPAVADEVHDAAREGDLVTLQTLIKKSPALVDARDENGRTPLHWACMGVHPEAVRYLVEAGADVNAADDSGVTPLHSLAFRGETEFCNLLIDRGADVNAAIAGGTTSIFLAVRAGHLDVVELLLDSGVDVDSKDGLENTPLITASSYGHADIVALVVDRGAVLNVANERGATALDVARREGNSELEEMLSSLGAAPGVVLSEAPKGDYLGQPRPQSTPALFAPGFVSTEKDQLNAVWSIDGKEFYFAQQGTQTRFVIMLTHRESNGWTPPARVPVAGKYAAVDLFIDGSRMYFCSDRPLEGDGEAKSDYDLWFVDRFGSGWGEPQHMGSVVNSDKNDFYPTLTRDGTVYFSSHREGGLGQNDIYRAMLVGDEYSKPENLGAAINTEFAEFDPFVAPDESYLIFTSGRPGGLGASDLYVSFRDSNGEWLPARNMGEDINSTQQDLTPMVTPDGAYLFFTSRRAGVSDLYWIDASVIDNVFKNRRGTQISK